MILIFGGTTEGRIAADVCDKAAKKYLYSTRNGDQRVIASNVEQICGTLNSEEIKALCEQRGVRLIIDAAHPFAEVLHTNIALAARGLTIPVIRFERRPCAIDYHRAITFESLDSAITYIKQENIRDIFATTGVKSAHSLAQIADSHNVTLRIMDREESNLEIARSGFNKDRVVYYNSNSNNDIETCKKLNISAILTKESGESGGIEQKIAAAKSLNIPLFIIARPTLPASDEVVFGQHGLRRAIESLHPDFFELHTGFTTGSAATAATAAALITKLSNQTIESVTIELPNSERISIPIDKTICNDDSSQCWVTKDGGDDPDATDKLQIVSRLIFKESPENIITLKGGEGVGVVTLPGIGIEVGEAAINPVPRAMILENVRQILNYYGATNLNIEIEISVPRGAEIAPKTFNPRLGIEGGISILGTSGIVQPFSAEAFLESIKRQIEIVKAIGINEIAINSGAKSERFIKKYYPDLTAQSYIHYGNLIGDTISLAASEGITRVVLGVMIGKAIKLANGALDTHSKRVTMDHDFLSEVALQAGYSEDKISEIMAITTARQLWDILPADHQFFQIIVQRCYQHTKPLLPNGELDVLLIGEQGDIVKCLLSK